mmetsp:Transcript_71808/g.190506  ORF Transcript_71808/g.190506 Transcript_71808/m.190506 type:complete len:368 (+) Transcript_71808:229-1332(+)
MGHGLERDERVPAPGPPECVQAPGGVLGRQRLPFGYGTVHGEGLVRPLGVAWRLLREGRLQCRGPDDGCSAVLARESDRAPRSEVGELGVRGFFGERAAKADRLRLLGGVQPRRPDDGRAGHNILRGARGARAVLRLQVRRLEPGGHCLHASLRVATVRRLRGLRRRHRAQDTRRIRRGHGGPSVERHLGQCEGLCVGAADPRSGGEAQRPGRCAAPVARGPCDLPAQRRPGDQPGGPREPPQLRVDEHHQACCLQPDGELHVRGGDRRAPGAVQEAGHAPERHDLGSGPRRGSEGQVGHVSSGSDRAVEQPEPRPGAVLALQRLPGGGHAAPDPRAGATDPSSLPALRRGPDRLHLAREPPRCSRK